MKLFTALAALTLIAAPVQADTVYLDCSLKRVSDGNELDWQVSFNENEQSLTRFVAELGSQTTFRNASISPAAIAWQQRVSGFTLSGSINRANGEVQSFLGSKLMATGQCVKAATPVERAF